MKKREIDIANLQFFLGEPSQLRLNAQTHSSSVRPRAEKHCRLPKVIGVSPMDFAL